MGTKMPRNEVRNDGAGPYAVFFCDICSREFSSSPDVAAQVGKGVGQGIFKGILRSIPLVGYDVANAVGGTNSKPAMNPGQLEKAWDQVKNNFHECGTCGKIVCSSDWNAAANSCAAHGGAQISATCPKCGTAANGAKFCPNCGTPIEAPKPASTICTKCGTDAKGGNFCPNCGNKMGG